MDITPPTIFTFLLFYLFTFLLFYSFTLLPFKAIVQHEVLNFLL